MIVELAGSPANQLLLASDPPSVGVEWLPYAAILGAVAGIWLFFKVLELIRRLFVPLVVAAVVVLVGQGIDWPADFPWPFGAAGASEQAPEIPPLGDWLPPR